MGDPRFNKNYEQQFCCSFPTAEHPLFFQAQRIFNLYAVDPAFLQSVLLYPLNKRNQMIKSFAERQMKKFEIPCYPGLTKTRWLTNLSIVWKIHVSDPLSHTAKLQCFHQFRNLT